jgi:uridine phosphorylase
MGMPSISILLHEVAKALHYAGSLSDCQFFRLGTCGGLGVEPGTVVVTTQSVNGKMEPTHETVILGRSVHRPALSDPDLANTLHSISQPLSFPVVLGKTLSCNCFYEGQGRVDGAICDYTEQDKFDFLHKAFAAGNDVQLFSIISIDMLIN